MKKFAIISSIAGGICIVLGIIIITVTAVSGASLITAMKQVGVYHHNSGSYVSPTEQVWMENRKLAFESIEDLKVEMDAGSLKIYEGEAGSQILVAIKDRNGEISCQAEDNGKCLEIKVDTDDSHGFMNGLHHWYQGREERVVELTVPEGFQFREVEIDSDVGSVWAESLRAQKLKVQTDVGYVDMPDTTVESGAEISCDVGSVNMVLEGSREDFACDLECDMGTIEIGTEAYSGMVEKEEARKEKERYLEVNCGIGSVTIGFTE